MISAVSAWSPVKPASARPQPRFAGQLSVDQAPTVVGHFVQHELDKITGFSSDNFRHVPNNGWFEYADADINAGTSVNSLVQQALDSLEGSPREAFAVIWLNNTHGKTPLMSIDWMLFNDAGKQIFPPNSINVQAAKVSETKNGRLGWVEDGKPHDETPPGCRLHNIKLQRPTPMGFIFVYRERPRFEQVNPN